MFGWESRRNRIDRLQSEIFYLRRKVENLASLQYLACRVDDLCREYGLDDRTVLGELDSMLRKAVSRECKRRASLLEKEQ